MTTVFLSELKTSQERSVPVLIETMTQHIRGTVCDVNEDGAFIVLRTLRAMGDRGSTTSLAMAEILSVTLNG